MMFHSFTHLCGPPLDSLHQVYFLGQNFTCQVWPHQRGKRRVVNSFDLLVALSPPQPNMQLATSAARALCWLTVSSLLTRTSKSLSGSIPAPVKAGACSCSSSAEFPEVPLCPFPQIKELWMAAHSRGGSAPAPVLYHQQTGWWGTLSQSPVIYHDKHYQNQNCSLEEPSTGDWPPAGSHIAGHKPLG